VGAARLSVTVHVDEPPLPPMIVDGLHATALTVCASARGTHSAETASTIPLATRYFDADFLEIMNSLYCAFRRPPTPWCSA